MLWFIAAFILIWFLPGIRKIETSQAAVIFRNGKPHRVLQPGWNWIIPFIEKAKLVATEPLSVSLPPQSAITRDEIPIQLQASMDASLHDPMLAASAVRDWRVQLMSRLQDLMKDKLEDLDFESLDTAFPQWTDAIRKDLNSFADQIGVILTNLNISNLSPRSKPVEEKIEDGG